MLNVAIANFSKLTNFSFIYSPKCFPCFCFVFCNIKCCILRLRTTISREKFYRMVQNPFLYPCFFLVLVSLCCFSRLIKLMKNVWRWSWEQLWFDFRSFIWRLWLYFLIFLRSVHHFGPDWNISTAVGWIVMKFGSCILCLQRMNPNDFSDPQIFLPAPP